MAYLKRLTLRHWAWINFKVALGLIWAPIMAFYTPAGVEIALGQPLVSAWMLTTMLGTVISIVGIIMTVGEGKVGVYGISVELVGLILFVVGPTIYFVTQLWLLFENGPKDRLAITAFAWAMVTVFIYRFVIVVPRFRREANDETKEV